ncbi:sporulation protein Cse60 [Levilactobacillus sp. N40-8-2]|uniref:sporulation protein Cse60 n=1 Tax=Levilactobacillus muriae TaxID=3238987 RepID=UPI0038B3D69C
MYQVKIFDCYRQNLEKEINRWLRDHRGVRLIDIKYLFDEGNDFSMIIYKNGGEGLHETE